jgi:succinyl-diaminopimelate desuccinylase
METEPFLAAASELLAMPSTADRPDELRRALNFVVDFVGPGFTVERFESGGKPSALIYREGERPRFRVILNAHLDVVPAPPPDPAANHHARQQQAEPITLSF